MHDLKDFAADWKNYTSLAPEARQKGAFKWTYPTRCRDSVGVSLEKRNLKWITRAFIKRVSTSINTTTAYSISMGS